MNRIWEAFRGEFLVCYYTGASGRREAFAKRRDGGAVEKGLRVSAVKGLLRRRLSI